MSTDFWPPVGTDPILDGLYSDGHYRIDALPRTALELLDRLRQLGYSISKLEDLNLDDPESVPLGERFDRHALEAARGVSRQVADGLLDRERFRDVSHESSSRGVGAVTPTGRSVEEAADSAAGPAGGPLAPGRSAGGAA